MMKPIVNVYEDELEQVLSNKLPTNGIAFEYPGENVFHIHTSMPKVSPSGVVNIAILSNLTFKQFQTFNTEQAGAFFKDNQNTSSTSLSQNAVVIVFSMSNDQLLKKGFVVNTMTGQTVECEVRYVPLKGDLYSRSKGLLETDVLTGKRVAIVGLGSFGSMIAIELAKAGIGNFYLFDFDRLEHHNLARHTCGIYDLGRMKTHAMRDQILLKNPYAAITTREYSILDHPEEVKDIFSTCDIIVCATDNNPSRELINSLALKLRTVAIFGKAYTRALGGDVFRLRPEGPCYSCIVDTFQHIKEEISNIKQARENSPAYVPESTMKATVQVGLSSDITPICNMMVKLVLVELSRGLPSGIQSLETELTYDYYFWVNRRDDIYQAFAPFNGSMHRPTILKWYGVQFEKDPLCMTCG